MCGFLPAWPVNGGVHIVTVDRRRTMKALRYYAPEDVRIEDVPEPECGPDEVKLKVRNCSTCGTDVKIFHNGHQNLSPPRTIGHEIAGEVVEVGANVHGWSVG